ncbi:hypothetical protein ABH924_003739 [Arthrobacter sp. GAS37]|uniref:hypothetical protein n=1 Tax=Arthrobacter sp. GAS37 TaxID=3156261 RepID=UPI00383416FC
MSACTGDRFALSPRIHADREWFGLLANPSGTINVPLADPYRVTPDPAAPWHDRRDHTKHIAKENAA